MRLTPTQKTVLKGTDAKSRMSAADIGEKLGIPPGPAARCVKSLVDKDLMKVASTKEGVPRYARTGEGGKVAKKL